MPESDCFEYAWISLSNSWKNLIIHVFLGSWICVLNKRLHRKCLTQFWICHMNMEEFWMCQVLNCQGHTGCWIWFNNFWICLIMTKLWLDCDSRYEFVGILSILAFWIWQVYKILCVVCKFFDRDLRILNKLQIVNMNSTIWSTKC